MYFTNGLRSPEGPVVLDDGSIIVVEMSPDRGCITHISHDGKTKSIIARTGRPNGLAVDKNKFIWVAESLKPSLLKLSLDGSCESILDNCNGEPFLFPNDLAFGPDGALYLTDSGILAEDFIIDGKVRSDYKEFYYKGMVYKIDSITGDIEVLDTGIKFPNGIAFGPDNNLYVNETITGNVYRYFRDKDGKFGNREYFGNVFDDHSYDEIRGPDGMKFGSDGNLYVTVYEQGDITVLGQDGLVRERIRTNGNKPTNCVFGLPGEKKLYVTELQFGTVEVLDVKTEGLSLYK